MNGLNGMVGMNGMAGVNGMNGMNGMNMNGMGGINGMNMNGGGGVAVGLPTPAGHQAELHIIYGMVEELSRQLADVKRTNDEITVDVGRVRSRARAMSMGNDELIKSAAEDATRGRHPHCPSLVALGSGAPLPPLFLIHRC